MTELEVAVIDSLGVEQVNIWEFLKKLKELCKIDRIYYPGSGTNFILEKVFGL